MSEYRGYYDPEKCTFTVNGHVITDWNRLEVDHANDRWTGHESGSGTVYMGKNPSLRGGIVLTLPTVNAHTGYLDSLAKSDEAFPISLIDESDSTRSARASICRIAKPATMTRAGGADATETSWTFVAADLTFGYQGDTTADVAAIPTG
jgi:hypothetical protein